jgi:hypothetical protein
VVALRLTAARSVPGAAPTCTATGFGLACTTSFRSTWSIRGGEPTPGQAPNATSALTSANMATDATSITAAVPALAM